METHWYALGTPRAEGTRILSTYSGSDDGRPSQGEKEEARVVELVRERGRSGKGEQAGRERNGPNDGGVPGAHCVEDDSDGNPAG